MDSKPAANSEISLIERQMKQVEALRTKRNDDSLAATATEFEARDRDLEFIKSFRQQRKRELVKQAMRKGNTILFPSIFRAVSRFT